MEGKINVLLVGDHSGKTSLISVFLEKKFPAEKGFNKSSLYGELDAKIFVDDRTVQVSVMEMNKCENDPSGIFMRTVVYERTDVVVICFAIDSPNLDNIDVWMEDLKKQYYQAPMVPVVLVGTKSDLRDNEDEIQELVSKEHAQSISNDISAFTYLECSAKKDQGVHEVFEAAYLASISSFHTY